MIIYFGEIEKIEEKVSNIKKAKIILEEIHEKYPVLWQEFVQLINETEEKSRCEK